VSGSGRVIFIGAGPGDPDLITVKGRRALEAADVVLFADSLVADGLVALARPGVEIHRSAGMDLEEQEAVFFAAWQAGKTVARVHSGDPSVFGATQEQVEILKKHGIPYAVIPGVSSFQAASAALQKEFTIPELTQTVILTRAAGRTEMPSGERMADLARHQATLVVYLSATLAKKVQEDCLAGGYPPETPCAVVYKVSWPDERIIQCPLSSLAETVKQSKIDRQALLIVSPALKEGHNTKSKLYDKTFTHGYRKGKG
jgi:precorrin-4/cobalt-precorrin-4 C11-methyltransferase